MPKRVKVKRCQNCQPLLPLDIEFATDDVPWERSGYPMSNNKGRRWGRGHANVGILRHRLLSDMKLVKASLDYNMLARRVELRRALHGRGANQVSDR